MHFIHGTADESVIYQSLHNAFIQIVDLLYCEISLNNDGNSEEKYYTNTIKLYLLWRDEATKQRENEYAATSEHIRVGTKLSKK
jgi:hypothetical protein